MRHLLALLLLLPLAGCLRVAVDPVEVKPITLNVNLKVDRQLDDFFAFEKELGPVPATAPATRPVTTESAASPAATPVQDGVKP